MSVGQGDVNKEWQTAPTGTHNVPVNIHMQMIQHPIIAPYTSHIIHGYTFDGEWKLMQHHGDCFFN